MYNRYQGNTGRVVRVEEKQERQPPARGPAAASAHGTVSPPPARRQSGNGLMEQLGRLLPGAAEPLETDDLLLLLILYLMYRESGDSELLIIMGAMFLL